MLLVLFLFDVWCSITRLIGLGDKIDGTKWQAILKLILWHNVWVTENHICLSSFDLPLLNSNSNNNNNTDNSNSTNSSNGSTGEEEENTRISMKFYIEL